MRLIKEAFSKIKSIIEKWKSIEVPTFVEWTLFGLIAVFIFACFIYWDIFVTTTHTTNLISLIFQGKVFEFYKFNYGLLVKGEETIVCYDLPIYIPFIIWDFPIWVFQRFFNLDIMTNFLSMLWMKGISVLFLGLSAVVIKKICQEMKIKESYIKWIILIFLSTPIVFSSVFILCQYDVIPIFFILLGILAYIKGDQKKFLIWFSIAIPMKLFALFVFIPLLLLYEKKVSRIIVKSLATGFCLAIFRTIELMMPFYKESTEVFNYRMLSKLINSSTLSVNFGGASLFIIAYIIICVYCYIKEIKNKNELYNYSIYIPFVVFCAFFAFVNFHPQWIIYLTPFFPILLFRNSKYFKVNLLIESVFNFIALFTISYYFPGNYGAEQVDGMLLTRIFGSRALSSMAFRNVRDIYIDLKFGQYLTAVYGAFFAALVCLAVINFPKLNEKKHKIEIEKSTILIRMLLILPLAILMIYCYFS